MPLRDVMDSDLPVFYEHQRDEEAGRMAASAPREWDAFLAHWRERVLGDVSSGKKTVLVEAQVAGNVVSWDQDGQRLVGYWIGRDHWGHGVASAALKEYLQHETRRPLHAYVAVHNLASIRVLEKCGFRRVGDSHTGADGVEELRFRLER